MGDKRPGLDRRQVLKFIVIGGVATAVAMPSKWVKPVVNAVIPPAHAAASAPATTKPGTAPATTAAGTTKAGTTTTTTTTTTKAPISTTPAPATTTFTKGQTGTALNALCDANVPGVGNLFGQAIDSKTLYCANSSTAWTVTFP